LLVAQIGEYRNHSVLRLLAICVPIEIVAPVCSTVNDDICRANDEGISMGRPVD
jgi:hypothetical protein